MQELPLAPPEYEQWLKELFPLEMTPEEYAARFGHLWGCFGGTEYRYRDARLYEWVLRFYQGVRVTCRGLSTDRRCPSQRTGAWS
jgi:hypothetical protein